MYKRRSSFVHRRLVLAVPLGEVLEMLLEHLVGLILACNLWLKSAAKALATSGICSCIVDYKLSVCADSAWRCPTCSSCLRLKSSTCWLSLCQSWSWSVILDCSPATEASTPLHPTDMLSCLVDWCSPYLLLRSQSCSLRNSSWPAILERTSAANAFATSGFLVEHCRLQKPSICAECA